MYREEVLTIKNGGVYLSLFKMKFPSVLAWYERHPFAFLGCILLVIVMGDIDSTVHEFGHWLVLKYLGLPTQGFRPGLCPIPPNCPREVFLGGPVASIVWGILLLAGGMWFWNNRRRVWGCLVLFSAVTSFFGRGVYNLVPDRDVPFKDGSRYFFSESRPASKALAPIPAKRVSHPNRRNNA